MPASPASRRGWCRCRYGCRYRRPSTKARSTRTSAPPAAAISRPPTRLPASLRSSRGRRRRRRRCRITAKFQPGRSSQRTRRWREEIRTLGPLSGVIPSRGLEGPKRDYHGLIGPVLRRTAAALLQPRCVDRALRRRDADECDTPMRRPRESHSTKRPSPEHPRETSLTIQLIRYGTVHLCTKAVDNPVDSPIAREANCRALGLPYQLPIF